MKKKLVLTMFLVAAVVLLPPSMAQSAWYSHHTSYASFSSAVGGAMLHSDNIDSYTTGADLKDVPLSLIDMTVTTNMSVVEVWRTVDKNLFGLSRGDLAPGEKAYYEIIFNGPYNGVAFDIESWDPAACGPGVVDVNFADGTVASINVYQNGALESDPVFFGILADTEIASLRYTEPDETDCTRNEETTLDNFYARVADLDGDGVPSSVDCDDADPGVGGPSTWYYDVDEGVGDGYGDATQPLTACTQPVNHVANNTDCDPTDASIYPGAPEVCNGLDDNCSGIEDDGISYDQFFDNDEDGFGTDTFIILDCEPVPGFVEIGGDCNDKVPTVYPGAPELCDGLDNDCDGVLSAGETDTDLDGVMVCEGDNCPTLSNKNQNDGDGDGVGDVCDNCPADYNDTQADVCSTKFTEAFFESPQYTLDEDKSYTVCLTKALDPPTTELIIGLRCDTINLYLESCVIQHANGDPDSPVDPPKENDVYMRPVGLGCPSNDPSELIDVIWWGPGDEECITCNLDDFYELDPVALGMGPGDTLVCDLGGRVVTKGIVDNLPWGGDDGPTGNEDDCRDPVTGLIPIVPIDQPIEVVPFATKNAVHARIDFKPGNGDEVDPINVGHSPQVPVVIYGSDGSGDYPFLDVSKIDLSTLSLRGRGANVKGKKSLTAEDFMQDEDGDGIMDMIVHVETDALEIDGGYGYLGFTLISGEHVQGYDKIRVVPLTSP